MSNGIKDHMMWYLVIGGAAYEGSGRLSQPRSPAPAPVFIKKKPNSLIQIENPITKKPKKPQYFWNKLFLPKQEPKLALLLPLLCLYSPFTLSSCEMQMGAGIILAHAVIVNYTHRRTRGKEVPAWKSHVLPVWRVVLARTRRQRSHLTLLPTYLCQTPVVSMEETGTKGRSGEDLISLDFLLSVEQHGEKPWKICSHSQGSPRNVRQTEISSWGPQRAK